MNPNRPGMLTKINDHFFPEKENIDQAFIYLRDEITLESCGEVIETILAINQPQFEEDNEGFMVEQEMPDVMTVVFALLIPSKNFNQEKETATTMNTMVA